MVLEGVSLYLGEKSVLSFVSINDLVKEEAHGQIDLVIEAIPVDKDKLVHLSERQYYSMKISLISS